MKKIFLLLALVFVAGTFVHCEKDDICDANTPTTPRLIIEFYDISSPTTLKNITDLQLISDITGLDTLVFNGVSKIQVPLNTDEDRSQFRFILNSESTDPLLIFEDTLEFNYGRETVFVSRACGYKTLFDLNNDISLPDPYVLNGNPNATTGEWIKNIIIEKYNLENENETHIKIYF
jgi:uncharacterized protein DUF6452